ncbi:MAG: hypothetical protein Q8O00_11905 [Holophaga sp.]|nr:hypothetical protein [Holophaga sp.]
MTDLQASPWIPPASPSLERLAWEAADSAGLATLKAWPQVHMAGVAFGGLPAFLCWQVFDGANHLVLLQVREIGALLRQSSLEVLPEDWLNTLDLESLARPLAIHPDFSGGVAVHVVQLLGPGHLQVREFPQPAPGAVLYVVERLTGITDWTFR